MKKIILMMVFVSILCFDSYGQKVNLMPVTTSSASALDYYNKAMTYFMDVRFAMFNRYLTEALREDPQFFMANYQRAFVSVWFGNEKNFVAAAEAAISSKTKLSKAEQLMRDALVIRLSDRNTDLTELGKKLVSMYPQDMNSYLQLCTFQYINKDYEGGIATIKKSLELDTRKDFMYNSLAYFYMDQGKYSEAEKALDKYIELSPNLPNPYDSKGEFYMRTKQYDKAYVSYRKANQIDSTWSKGNMQKAKSLADDMVLISEVQVIMNNIKKGLNDLDADVVFKNADKEHFLRFVSNGTVSDDFSATLTGFKELYSNFKNASVLFTNEDYRVLSPTTVLFTGNFSEVATAIKGDQLKIQGVMTVIFRKAGDHWNISYVHQSYFPVQ